MDECAPLNGARNVSLSPYWAKMGFPGRFIGGNRRITELSLPDSHASPDFLWEDIVT